MKDISQKRHLAKTITWRVLASLTTFVIALIFFREDPLAAEKATGVALTESVIKMGLYYFHERIWYKSNFGLKSRRSAKKIE
ncbi:DUF2061 domain-containing protein [Urechidicola vernalis]|uniref:DUF2061 domain-containing protein n=1 Tax=Urechidicola vernalis TaxID=3075600 RepID=A0ABU2Y7F3_9FLAO|nr:DUF2061 domain-containing protein [Urechidicola sp. P050]MDT0554138.1 DUF2061 domain-containing protein [Urechidicola sp. P050]